MSDLISRSALLESLIHCDGLGRKSCEAVVKAIHEQPTVEAKPVEWIPCSDRLPEEEEAYSYNEEEDAYEPNEFIVMIEGAELPTVAFFDGEDFTGGYNNEFFNKVIAWMPFPEPYNADMRKKVE